MLTKDSQIIFMLTSWLPSDSSEANSAKILSSFEYSKLAKSIHAAGWKGPSEFVEKSNQEIQEAIKLRPNQIENIRRLLDRAGQATIEYERFQNQGIDIITRADHTFPSFIKRELGDECPPFLWYQGNINLLQEKAELLVYLKPIQIDYARIFELIRNIKSTKHINYFIEDEWTIKLILSYQNLNQNVISFVAFGLQHFAKYPEMRKMIVNGNMLTLSRSYPSFSKSHFKSITGQLELGAVCSNSITIIDDSDIGRNDQYAQQIKRISKKYQKNLSILGEFSVKEAMLINVEENKNEDQASASVEVDEIPTKLFSIGHSSHSIEQFIELLNGSNIEILVDVRSQPFSRYSPHFDKDQLERHLEKNGIKYIFMGDKLGGRPSDVTVLNSNNKIVRDIIEQRSWYWDGIQQLVNHAREKNVAFMCSEEDPFHCHRGYIISNTLQSQKNEVMHIRGNGKIQALGYIPALSDQTEIKFE